MKKVLFLFIAFFGVCSCAFSKSLSIFELASGEVDEDIIYTSSDDIYSMGYGSFFFNVIVAYYDINGEMIESFYVDSAEYNDDYELINIGQSCREYYSDNTLKCTISNNGVYFSDKNLNDIKYWKLLSSGVDNSRDDLSGLEAAQDFCISNPNIKDSNLCSVIYTSLFSYGTVVLKFVEYNPVSFELVCEPEEVKKGEITSCKLKAKAEDNVVEVTINPNSETYEVVDYKETEGWTSVKNEDGTITLKNEEGFKGEDFIVSVDLKFKEAILDDVVVELTDISYTTASGATLKSTVNDKVNIYEEPEEEIKEEVEKNPETIGFTPGGSLLILLLSLILLIVYRKRVNEGM